MPEGDSLHRAARRLQVLVGQRVEVETPHPRAAVKNLAARLDGRVLEAVDAVGKNLFLRFEGGLTLRSHLRMNGRWWVQRRGARRFGRPWLVLRGDDYEGVQWNGPVLELDGRQRLRLGPDILGPELDPDEIVARLRAQPRSRAVGDALLDQRIVAGIGNMWRAEALWTVRVSPWRALGELRDDELREVVTTAASLMQRALETRRQPKAVTSRTGRGCPRCGTPIRSRPQGDANRTAYWCPSCQP